MQFRSLTILLLGTLAAAQTLTTTTTAASGTETSLPDLVGQIDSCVLGCIRTVAPEVGCSSTDFNCLCSTNVDDFRNKITSCVLSNLGSCSISEAQKSAKLIGPICDIVKDSPNPSDVASASRIVAGGAEETGSANNDDDGDSAANAVVANSFLALVVALFLI